MKYNENGSIVNQIVFLCITVDINQRSILAHLTIFQFLWSSILPLEKLIM